MRIDRGPGSNPDFVLALKYLFNREQMLKTIQLDHGVVANDQPIAATNRFYFKGLPQRPFDPEKAKWHLQKANLGSAPMPVVASPAAPLGRDGAGAAANGEADRLEPRRQAHARRRLLVYSLAEHPLGFGNVNPRPSVDIALTQFFKSDAPWNESRYKSDKFDQLLVAARCEIDTAKRAQMYADLQTMIHNDAGIGIPMFISSLDGTPRKLKGLSPIPLGGMMGSTFAENVWLEA